MRSAGKYDAQLGKALKSAGAKQGVLIVLDGKNGSSICVKASEEMHAKLPELLRSLADHMEEEAPSYDSRSRNSPNPTTEY